MSDADEELLERHGWTVECSSPREVRHDKTGSFVSLLAVDYLLFGLRQEDKEENSVGEILL